MGLEQGIKRLIEATSYETTTEIAADTVSISGSVVLNQNKFFDMETGLVTQATSNSTAVTLNKVTGIITMFGVINAVTSEEFTLNNDRIGENSIITPGIQATTSGSVACSVAFHTPAAGSVVVLATNHDGVNTTNVAPKIHYVITNPA